MAQLNTRDRQILDFKGSEKLVETNLLLLYVSSMCVLEESIRAARNKRCGDELVPLAEG